MSGASQFACAACGRKYAWKTELAGKKVRCKCGQPVAVPTGGAVASVTAGAPQAVASRAAAGPMPVMPVAAQPARPPVAKRAIPVEPEHHDDAPGLDDLYALAGDDDKVRQAAEADAAAGLRCPSCSSQAEPGAMICLTCGMNFQTGQKMSTAIGVDDAPKKKKRGGTVYQGVQPATPGGGPAVLGYAGRNPRAAAAEVALQKEGMKHLMWPIIMVVLGVIMTMVYYMVGRGYGFAGALVIMGLSTAIDLVLLFVACLIAIKMLDISLGAPGEAVLKLIAVALLPAAVEGLIGSMFPGGFMLGWAVAYGLYLTLLMWFFDLDGSETMILSVIIWAIRTWAGMAIVGLILGAVMSGSAITGSGNTGGSTASQSAVQRGFFGGSNLVMDQSPAGRENYRADTMLQRVGSEDLEKFLARGDKYTISGYNREESLEVLENLKDAGAIKIMTSDVKTFPDGGTVTDKLVVELPVDAEERAELFSLYKERVESRSNGLIQLKDNGSTQGYMILDFDGNTDF